MHFAIIAQVLENNWPIILNYGAIGLICMWLMFRDERRDKLMREMNRETTSAINNLAHKFNGLTRALIFNAATYAPNGVKEMAQAELEKMEAKSEAREESSRGRD